MWARAFTASPVLLAKPPNVQEEEALHASKPNEVIQFDYLYMTPSVGDAKYVLIVTDDTATTFGSRNARMRMLTVQQPYSSNGSLPLVWLSNGFPTKAVASIAL
jgi:hypothetical protein